MSDKSREVTIIGKKKAGSDGKASVAFEGDQPQSADVTILGNGDVYLCQEQSDGSMLCWEIQQ